MTSIRDALAGARRRYADRMAAAADRDAAHTAQLEYEKEVAAVVAPALRDGASLGLSRACEDALSQARRVYLDGLQKPSARRGCSAWDTYVEQVAAIVAQHGDAASVADAAPDGTRRVVEIVRTTDTAVQRDRDDDELQDWLADFSGRAA